MIFAVGVIGDTVPATDVVVSFFTVDGSISGRRSAALLVFVCSPNLFVGRIAMNGSDFIGQSNVLLTFNAATRSIEIEVDLIDDLVFEGEEDFNGILTLVLDSPSVTIDPDNALASIGDNEGV